MDLRRGAVVDAVRPLAKAPGNASSRGHVLLVIRDARHAVPAERNGADMPPLEDRTHGRRRSRCLSPQALRCGAGRSPRHGAPIERAASMAQSKAGKSSV